MQHLFMAGSDNVVFNQPPRLDDYYPIGSGFELEQFDPERWDGMS